MLPFHNEPAGVRGPAARYAGKPDRTKRFVVFSIIFSALRSNVRRSSWILSACSIAVIVGWKRVCQVGTQEPASAHIAVGKAIRLRSPRERKLCLILNQCEAGYAMTDGRISNVVGVPVEATIPSNYRLANLCSDGGEQNNLGRASGIS